MAVLKAYWRRKIIEPIIALLKQGVTYRKIALSIALGISLGIFPVLGTSTLLCVLAAVIFRLNLLAIQLVNYLVYPLQLLLLIPFFRAGELLLSDARVTVTLDTVVDRFKADWLGALNLLGETLMHAAVVWLLISPILTLLMYHLLKPALRSLDMKFSPATRK
jgi:uncharacterized protein (DUF2062 family)